MPRELLPHNKDAYKEVSYYLNNDGACALVQATGTGKSSVIEEVLEDYWMDSKLLLVPQKNIAKQFMESPNWVEDNITIMTYHAFQRLYIRGGLAYKFPSLELIVADEMHRLGAKKWGEAFTALVKMFPNAKRLGATATPKRVGRNQIDVVETYFGGNVASDIDIIQAMDEKILPVLELVEASWDFKSMVDAVTQKLIPLSESKKASLLQDECEAIRFQHAQKFSVDKVLKRRLGPRIKGGKGLKILVFCPNLESIPGYVNEFHEFLTKAFTKYRVNSHIYTTDTPSAEKVFQNFKDKPIEDFTFDLLYSVGKLIEGVHAPGIEVAFNLRKSKSYRVMIQLIGRVMSAGDIARGISPMVIDFVNGIRDLDVSENSPLVPPSDTDEKDEREARWTGGDVMKYVIEVIDETGDLGKKLKSVSYRTSYLASGRYSVIRHDGTTVKGTIQYLAEIFRVPLSIAQHKFAERQTISEREFTYKPPAVKPMPLSRVVTINGITLTIKDQLLFYSVSQAEYYERCEYGEDIISAITLPTIRSVVS